MGTASTNCEGHRAGALMPVIPTSVLMLHTFDREKLAPTEPREIFLCRVAVSGIGFHAYSDRIEELKSDADMVLCREPTNRHDNNAIAVKVKDGGMLGYVSRTDNPVLARLMDAGKRLNVKIDSKDRMDWRVSIRISMIDV